MSSKEEIGFEHKGIGEVLAHNRLLPNFTMRHGVYHSVNIHPLLA